MKDTVNFDRIVNRKSHSHKYFYALVVILIVLFAVNSLVSMEKNESDSDVNSISDTKFLQQCHDLLENKNTSHIVCCQEDNEIVDCTDKEKFIPYEKICLQADLQKLNQYYDKYYACGVSDLKGSMALPDNYEKDTKFSEEGFGCSQLFDNDDYHHGAEIGFVPDKDTFIISRIYLYPEDNYETKQDFLDDLKNAKNVLSVSGDTV